MIHSTRAVTCNDYIYIIDTRLWCIDYVDSEYELQTECEEHLL